MTDLVMRPLSTGEEPLFGSLADPGHVGLAAFSDRYSDMAAHGECRRTWIALWNGRVVARAAWWAGPRDNTPRALAWFDFTDPAAAVQLLRTAPLRTGYCLELASGWRDNPAISQAAQAWVTAAQAAGLTRLVERYQYQWTPGCGLPVRPGRPEFCGRG